MLKVSLQRLKSHIGSMIRHNATITQIVLQQCSETPKTLRKAPRMNVHAPIFYLKKEKKLKNNNKFRIVFLRKKERKKEGYAPPGLGHLDRASFRTYFGYSCPQ